MYPPPGEGLGSALLYYRKPVWATLMKRGEAQLKESFVLACGLNDPAQDVVDETSGVTAIGGTAGVTADYDLDDDFKPRPSRVPEPWNATGGGSTSFPLEASALTGIGGRDRFIFKSAPFVRLVPKKHR